MTTVVAEPRWLVRASWVGCPVLGAALGWGLTFVVHWLTELRWVPFRGPLELYDSMGEPLRTLIGLAVGLVAGVALAVAWDRERLTVTVAPDQVTLATVRSTVVVDRAEVAAVFLADKKLVLLDADGRELAREQAELPAAELRAAFVGGGLPWHDDGDPHAATYRLWVPDLPDLPSGAGAVLAARQRALDKGSGDDVTALRTELTKLGVVVRDEAKRQYVRTVPPHGND